MKKITGHFWISNRFIRIHAKNLSVYEQMVYVTLCCHAGRNPPTTFIGCRRIAEMLKIDKDTVNNAEKKLETYGYIERVRYKSGKVSHIKILPVPYETPIVSHQEGRKELIKEDIKEGNINKKENITSIKAIINNY